MFESTKKIIAQTEAYLVNFEATNKHVNNIARWLWFPLMYLLLGLKDFFKPTKFWWILLFALFALLSFAIKNFEISREVAPFLFNFCFYFSMVLAIFSMPSTYAYYGVEKEYVSIVVTLMKDEGIKTIDEVELIEQNMKKVHDRISGRVSFYKWLVGMAWTLYLLCINIETKFLTTLNSDELSLALADNLSTFIMTGLATLASLSLIVGYKRASETLVKSIEFACVDYKATLMRGES